MYPKQPFICTFLYPICTQNFGAVAGLTAVLDKNRANYIRFAMNSMGKSLKKCVFKRMKNLFSYRGGEYAEEESI